MRYATRQRVTQGIPEHTLAALTQDDPEARAADEAVIERLVADAEDLIDDHLRGRYALPLAAVPTTVANLAVKIARHDLYARRPETDVPKDVVREYDAALKMLREIRDGRLSLGLAESQAAQPEAGSVRVRVPDRQFGDDTLARYR